DWERIRAWADRLADAIEVLPRPAPAPAPRPSRWPLAALCWLVGLTALVGGLALVAAPDSALARLPLPALPRFSYTSFLVPSLLLLVVIGAGSALAGAMVLRDAPAANLAVLLAGFAL